MENKNITRHANQIVSAGYFRKNLNVSIENSVFPEGQILIEEGAFVYWLPFYDLSIF